jgi:hypothetical protein
MIKNGMLSEKFVGLTMKPTSKLISAFLKFKLTKMNLLSIKKKRKKYIVFPPRCF